MSLPPLTLPVLARGLPGALAALAGRGSARNPPHLRALDLALLRLLRRPSGRLFVTFPPRHGKSERISRTLPAWFLGNWPDQRVILASYEADFAASWGAKARDLLAEWGPSVFGVGVKEGAAAGRSWQTTRGGGMECAGVGGAVTGKGANLLIVDDPVKNAEEAFSKTHREKAMDFWRSTAYTRLEPQGRAVILMTRWHEADLGGQAIKEGIAAGEDWEVLELPAIAREGDPIGRAPGEALWPERYNKAALERIKAVVGPYFWSALYDGRPSPVGGGLYKTAWTKRCRLEGDGRGARLSGLPGGPRPIEGMLRFGTVDLACSERTSADYTVVSSYAWDRQGDLVKLGVDRARREGPEILPAIERAVRRWGMSFVAVESTGFQLSVVQAGTRPWFDPFTQTVRPALPLREVRPSGDKVSRYMPVTARAAAGRLWVPEGAAWAADWEAESAAFPAGDHDDQCDCDSYAEEAVKDLQAYIPGFAEAVVPPTARPDPVDEEDDDEPAPKAYGLSSRPSYGIGR